MLGQHPGVLTVSQSLRPRALGLVRALADEAQRRGHQLAISKKRITRGLFVQIRGRHCGVTVSEEHDHVPHVPAAGERRQQRRGFSWQPASPDYDLVPSGRLRIELPPSDYGQHGYWADTSRSRVEGKVRAAVKEIELRVAAEEEACRARKREHEAWLAAQQRKAAGERARWEAAMETARGRAIDDHHGTTFANALGAWHAAAGIRGFCAALEQAAAASPEPAQAQQPGAWITWGRDLADRIDPVHNLSHLTGAGFGKEPRPEDLRPHLGDWSLYGPHREYRPPQPGHRPPVTGFGPDDWRDELPGRAQWWRH